MATEKVVAQIVAEVDDQSLKKAWEDMKIFARDTKKEIDKNTLYSLILDKGRTKVELDTLRGLLRIAKKEWDKEAILKYTIQTQEVQSKLTEIGRSLNNLKNQWSESVSRLGALFDNLAKKLWGTNTAIWSFTTNLARGADKASESFSWVTESVGGFIGVSKGMLVWGAIATWIAGLTKQAITLWDKFEQASISFETLLWNGEKAQLFLEDLSEFAKQTPFELTGIRDTAKQLIAVGIESENVIPTMKALWDVASLLGWPDVFWRLTYAFWQVKTAWKLTWNELRQFTEAGIPLAEELWKVLGKSTDEIKKMISEWQISFADVQKAFVSMTSEGWRFANWQSAQIDTLTGKWGKLKDTINLLLEEIGTALLPFSKFVLDSLQFLTDWIVKVFVWLRLAGNLAVWYLIQRFIDLRIFFIQVLTGLSIWFSNFLWRFWIASQNFWVIVRNLWVFFKAFVVTAKESLNSWLKSIEDFLNKAGGAINNFAKRLWVEKDIVWKISLWRLDAWTITWEIEEFKRFSKETAEADANAFALAQEEKIQSLRDFQKAHKENVDQTVFDIASQYAFDKKVKTDMIINDDKVLDNEKDNAKGKSDLLKKEKKELEEYQKWLENMAKLREQNEEKRNKNYKTRIDNIKKAQEELWDVFQKEIDKSRDNIKKFDDDIEKILEKFKELKESLDDLESEKWTTLWERNVEILEREKEIQEELNKLKQEGVNIQLAQAIGLSSLKQISGDSEIWGSKVSDLIKAVELQNEQNELLREKEILIKNTTEEERKEAERVAWLSPTEKYLEEYNAKKKSIEDEIMLERMKIDALQKQKDEENAILEDFEKKKSDIDSRYAEKIAWIEAQITDKTILEIWKRLSALETLRQKAIQTAEAMRNTGVVYNTTNNTTNSPNVVVSANVSNDVDINNLWNKLANKITLSNKWID